MKRVGIVAAAIAACGIILPAAAADYYVATRYASRTDGEAALLVNAGTVHANDSGNTAAEFAAVNAGGVYVNVYSAEFNCAAKSWRVTQQADYDAQNPIAPTIHASHELPAFTPVNDGSPVQAVMTMVCNWPAGQAGAAKIEAIDPVALNAKMSPTLKFTAPGDDRR